MSIKVKLVGLENVIKKLTKYNFLKQKQIKDHIAITALNIESKAKKVVPVDRGGLKSSIRILYKAIDGLGVEVGTDLIYAHYIEFGTPVGTGENGGPRPYLNPAAESERPKYLKELRKILKSTK